MSPSQLHCPLSRLASIFIEICLAEGHNHVLLHWLSTNPTARPLSHGLRACSSTSGGGEYVSKLARTKVYSGRHSCDNIIPQRSTSGCFLCFSPTSAPANNKFMSMLSLWMTHLLTPKLLELPLRYYISPRPVQVGSCDWHAHLAFNVVVGIVNLPFTSVSSGTYNIAGTYCEPGKGVPSKRNTL
jgi:hypothetical protein